MKRQWFKRQLQAQIARRCRPHSGNFGDLLVLAPHYDDEVLGCGGAIACNLAAGRPVHVVFMTRGGKSHRHLIEEAQLARLRAAEADTATGILGIAPGAVRHLNIEEGTLPAHRTQAVDTISELLRAHRFDAVMAPYHRDNHDDHEQTNQIAQEAIARADTGIPLFEYPVWVWHQWPWCPLHLSSRSDVLHELPAALRASMNLIGDLDTCLDVRPFKALKSRALSAYKTQMTRVIDTPRWLTLADVSGGEFLANLLRDTEFYARVETS